MTTLFQKVESVSKKERVVSTLKAAVLSGKLQAGESIIEAKIAHQFGVGQSLIREALIHLEHQGFVQRTPFSGTQVMKLSGEDAQEIFDIRIALEPLAALLAGSTITSENLQELNALANKAKQAGEAEDLDSFFENHLAFRRRIWALSGNKYLLQALERVVIPLYALYFIRKSDKRHGILLTVADCLDHQQRVIDAYKASDATKAQRIIHDFLLRMKEYLRNALSADGEV